MLRIINKLLKKCEKQGEQKPTLLKWKYKKDRTPLLRDSIILNKYGCVTKSPSGALVSDVWIIDYDELSKLPKEEIEKQGEQKPAWSEEDELMILGVEQLHNCASLLNIIPDKINKVKQWLKSLKEKINEKQ